MENRSKILTTLEIAERNKEASIEFLPELIAFKTEVGSSYEDIQCAITKKLSQIGAQIDIRECDIEILKQSPWFSTPLEYYPQGFKEKPIVVGYLPGTGGGPGVMWFRVKVKGKSVHAARLWEGVNAIEKVLKIHKISPGSGQN